MKKVYNTPEFVVKKLTIRDVIMASIEVTVPNQEIPSEVPEGTEVPDF